ncbi:MAG: response regulator [bacterium]|nr:response regulator [bacterium]
MNQNLLNVIIVDDDELVVKSLQRVLQSESYYLWATTSAKKALSLLASQETAVIVSDHRMSEMTGIELLEKAKNISPATVRILLTGYADVEVAQESVNRCGVYKLLFKPWNDQELKGTIISAIGLFKHLKEKNRLVNESQLLNKRNQELTELNVFLQDSVDKGKLQIQKLTAEKPRPENTMNLRATLPRPESMRHQPGPNSHVDDRLLYLG